MSIQPGDQLPDFSLPATGDKQVCLSDFKGQNLLLYFYPKDSTPGCTNEGKDFTEKHAAFQEANTQVFGVSRDSLKSHEKFKAKKGFSFDLISDEDSQLCELFGVIKLKKMFGKEFHGIERSTFLIDKEGRLAKEWRKVKVAGHAQEALEAAQALA